MLGQDANFISTYINMANQQQLEDHLEVRRYGDFVLTDAIRPALDLTVVPCQGYSHATYYDSPSKQTIPVLIGAVSSESLFEVFLELLDPLGPLVDVVLETSHETQEGEHQDLYRDKIDLPVLKSILWDFEDLLLNDGCTGIAVLDVDTPAEVQFDEHKMLVLYGQDLTPFEEVYAARYVYQKDDMEFITDAEHIHSTHEHFLPKFDELKIRLGMDSEEC